MRVIENNTLTFFGFIGILHAPKKIQRQNEEGEVRCLCQHRSTSPFFSLCRDIQNPNQGQVRAREVGVGQANEGRVIQRSSPLTVSRGGDRR